MAAATATATATATSSCSARTTLHSATRNPYASASAFSPAQLPFKLKKSTTGPASAKSSSICCTIAREPLTKMETKTESDPSTWQRPDSFGRFGQFGGKYVPETLMHALSELETAFHKLAYDKEFQVRRIRKFFFFYAACLNFSYSGFVFHILPTNRNVVFGSRLIGKPLFQILSQSPNLIEMGLTEMIYLSHVSIG